MNYFEEGERLKAEFDSLVRQHKRSKKKILEGNNVDKDLLSKHERVRVGIMKFFEKNHSFIRPRKGSFGVFSVEDFVKCRVREAASFSVLDGAMGSTKFIGSPTPGEVYPCGLYGGGNGTMHRRDTVGEVSSRHFANPNSPFDANHVQGSYFGFWDDFNPDSRQRSQEMQGMDDVDREDGARHILERGGGFGLSRTDYLNQMPYTNVDLRSPMPSMGAQEDFVHRGMSENMPSPDIDAGRGRRREFVGLNSSGMYMGDGVHSGFLGGRMNSPHFHQQAQGNLPFVGTRMPSSPSVVGRGLSDPNFQFVSNFGMSPSENPVENRCVRPGLFPDACYRNGYNSEAGSFPYRRMYFPFMGGQTPPVQSFPTNVPDVHSMPSHSLARNIPPASTFAQTPDGHTPISYLTQGPQLFNALNGKYPSDLYIHGSFQSRVSDSMPREKRGRKLGRGPADDRKPSTSSTSGLPIDGLVHDVFIPPVPKASGYANEADMGWKEARQELVAGRDEVRDDANFQDDSHLDLDMPNTDVSAVNIAIEGANNTAPDKTIEDIINITGPHNPIDPETRKFIYELCDGFLDHIMHMSCALAYHRNKSVVEICDIKLSLKTEVDLELPEDSFDVSTRTESDEHVKRLKMIKRGMDKR